MVMRMKERREVKKHAPRPLRKSFKKLAFHTLRRSRRRLCSSAWAWRSFLTPLDCDLRQSAATNKDTGRGGPVALFNGTADNDEDGDGDGDGGADSAEVPVGAAAAAVGAASGAAWLEAVSIS